MVLWFYGYTASLGPVLANARPGASLGHDFMTLQAFPGFHNPMALCFCGSMVPRPRSAPVLASACPGASHNQDFMTFWGFEAFFVHWPCPLVSFDPKLCVIVGHH